MCGRPRFSKDKFQVLLISASPAKVGVHGVKDRIAMPWIPMWTPVGVGIVGKEGNKTYPTPSHLNAYSHFFSQDKAVSGPT